MTFGLCVMIGSMPPFYRPPDWFATYFLETQRRMSRIVLPKAIRRSGSQLDVRRKLGIVRPLFVAFSPSAPVLYNEDETTIQQGDLKMSVAESAKRVYEEDLRSRLEQDHMDEFVAIEPSSRRFFLGKTFLEVALAAKKAFPDRKSFVIRIGHEAAFHIGAFSP